MRDLEGNVNRTRTESEKVLGALKTFGVALKEGVYHSWGYVNSWALTAEKDFREIMINEIGKKTLNKTYDGAVVLCIGSAFKELKGDNIAPLVGSKLKEKGHIEGVSIYGTMDDPIYGTKSGQRIEEIYKKHPSSLVISVESIASYFNWQVGRIHIGEGTLNSDIIEANRKFSDVRQIEVNPIIINREKYETDMDICRKVAAVNGDTVNKMAEIISQGMHGPLIDAKQLHIIR